MCLFKKILKRKNLGNMYAVGTGKQLHLEIYQDTTIENYLDRYTHIYE